MFLIKKRPPESGMTTAKGREIISESGHHIVYNGITPLIWRKTDGYSQTPKREVDSKKDSSERSCKPKSPTSTCIETASDERRDDHMVARECGTGRGCRIAWFNTTIQNDHRNSSVPAWMLQSPLTYYETGTHRCRLGFLRFVLLLFHVARTRRFSYRACEGLGGLPIFLRLECGFENPHLLATYSTQVPNTLPVLNSRRMP